MECGEALTLALAAGDGLIIRRENPALSSAIYRATRKGCLQRVLPGIYASAGEIGLMLRARAAFHAEPAAVITGCSAAALTWWPEVPAPHLDLASSSYRIEGSGMRWQRRMIPPELVIERSGIRVAHPALTVLDLIPTLGGSAIDEALRRRAVRLDELNHVFWSLPARRGDAERRRLLIDSRDEPWSEAERELHHRYRSLECGHDYRTNYPVELPDGTLRYFDLALPDLLLAFEADGFEFHGGLRPFIADRLSDAAAAGLSWQRIRFAATSILAPDNTVTELMRAAIVARESLLRDTWPRGTRVRRPR